ncbi:MAG TPA: GNAT family N-acetyltransferase [Gemmatirosa sp.]
MTPVLTPAADHDLAAVAALVNSAYRGESSRQGWTTEADYLDDLRTTEATMRADLATDPTARLLLLREALDATLLGCVWLAPGDDAWYLGLLTVRPDLQDRQLGRTLLAGAEAVAREHGARRIRMRGIGVRDTLIAWYQRRGYMPTGVTEPFAHGDEPRPDLTFVALEKSL